jgi:tetratricopeptide (TPR) repeat protein
MTHTAHHMTLQYHPLFLDVANGNNCGAQALVEGDLEAARACFEHAMALLDNALPLVEALAPSLVHCTAAPLWSSSTGSRRTVDSNRHSMPTMHATTTCDLDRSLDLAYVLRSQGCFEPRRLDLEQVAIPCLVSTCTVVQATLCYNLALVQMQQCSAQHPDFDAAHDLLLRALQHILHGTLLLATLRIDGALVLPILHQLAFLSWRTGQYEAAQHYMELAVHHATGLLGRDSLAVAHALHGLGIVQYHWSRAATTSSTASCANGGTNWADHHGTLDSWTRALDILSRVPEHHGETMANVLQCQGHVWWSRKDHARALSCWVRALHCRHQQVVDSHSFRPNADPTVHPAHAPLEYAVTAYLVGQGLQQVGNVGGALVLYRYFCQAEPVQRLGPQRDGTCAKKKQELVWYSR